MYYKTFEDVPVWKKSREFVKDIFTLISRNKKLLFDYSLADQLRRAAYSIMLNIAEGFERGSNKDFARFIIMAKASASEVRAILYILVDNGYITQKDFINMKEKVRELSAHLYNFEKYLSASYRKR